MIDHVVRLSITTFVKPSRKREIIKTTERFLAFMFSFYYMDSTDELNVIFMSSDYNHGGSYNPSTKTIKINLRSFMDWREALCHEFCHYWQDKSGMLAKSFEYNSFLDYLNAPIEVEARLMASIVTEHIVKYCNNYEKHHVAFVLS